jgi:hypothetical protein
MSHYDAGLAREAVAGPIDTRQWVSYGTVSPETPDAKSTTFTKEYGPLVNVKLHPTGIPVVCRVAHEVAGNGEGEWFPFIEGDEVIVLIPEGDETAGCVIMGRLNQEIDFWPTIVAGQDPRLNNFAFRRMRTPYIFETAGGYLVNSATTGAFFSISDTGTITLSNADKAFLTLTADFLGLQNKDADVLIQIAVEKKQIVLNVPGVSMVLDSLTTHLYTLGTLQIGTSGAQAAWHATSIESVAVLLQALLTAIGATDPGPLTGAGLAGGAIALVNAALTAAAALPIAPLLTGVTGGLAIPSVPGAKPGLAAAALLIG